MEAKDEGKPGSLTEHYLKNAEGKDGKKPPEKKPPDDKKSWWDKLKEWGKGLRGKDHYRIEFHKGHEKGPHKYPHLQLIKGKGWGKTIGRFP